MKGDAVDELIEKLWRNNLQLPVAARPFSTERAWRFDAAWPERKIAVQIGRAITTSHLEFDNDATVAGWRILRLTRQMIRRGKAIAWLRAMLKEGK